MCHQYLKIDLGSKVNFVIGHNGSTLLVILKDTLHIHIHKVILFFFCLYQENPVNLSCSRYGLISLLGGKSAILSAITVALGAKANATNRGRNLSALIREDAK